MTLLTLLIESTKNKVLNKAIRNYSFHFVLFAAVVGMLFSACKRSIPDKPWSSTIPYNAPGVLIPKKGVTINEALKSKYMPFFDDLSSSAIPIVKKLSGDTTRALSLKAMIVYPNSSTTWQPVWVVQSNPGYLLKLSKNFYRSLSENHYYFDHVLISKIHIDGRTLYVAQIKQWGLISENSFGIEQSIRAYLGKINNIGIQTDNITPGTFILNGGSLDKWVDQESAVKFRPYILNAFKGIKPADLKVNQIGKTEIKNIHITGNIPLSPDTAQSSLTKAISTSNNKPILDQYIPYDAAGFALMHLPVVQNFPDTMKVNTRADSLLIKNQSLIHSIANDIDPQFCFVAFDPGGYLNIGENLFIRKLSNPDAFLSHITQLQNDSVITKQGSGYNIRSNILAQLIGSPMCKYQTFYLAVTGNAVVISPRMGLTNRVITDRAHNHVLYYTDIYSKIRNNIPAKFSALFFARSNRLYRYLKHYLGPKNNVAAITSKFDVLSAYLKRGPEGKNLKFDLRTYTTQKSNQPYQEKWIFPLNGEQLTGKPVLADMGGSSRNEILFATTHGNIYALASDGTVLLHTHTIGDTPVGSPIVYDWYGNNQSAIMVAAGNKIYAWNKNGDLLPKFPIKLGEPITAPITIADVTRDGLPKIIVATADRELHVLNGRGQDINGWPISTNAVIKKRPVYKSVDGRWSVFAVAENGLFAWNRNGSLRNGFPIFGTASYTTRPVIYDNEILTGSADGHLYTVGRKRMLSDSLNVYRHTTYDSLGNGLKMGALYVSNTAINGTPSVQNLTVRIDSSTTKKENTILLQSDNGAIFLYNTKGVLRFTQNMGQPSATNSSPFIADIRNDHQMDIMSLANYGRLYAWNILSGNRIYNLPTTAMQFPIITDLDGSGKKDLISQTQEGLQCWSLSNQPDVNSNTASANNGTQ